MKNIAFLAAAVVVLAVAVGSCISAGTRSALEEAATRVELADAKVDAAKTPEDRVAALEERVAALAEKTKVERQADEERAASRERIGGITGGFIQGLAPLSAPFGGPAAVAGIAALGAAVSSSTRRKEKGDVPEST